MLTASLWVSAWSDNTLVLLWGVGEVHAEVAHIAQLWVVDSEDPPATDGL